MPQIPNPFPQMGTAASMGYFFEPIGYSNDIKKIKESIEQNCNQQALMFNIIGDFGFGKTHFLRYFKETYKNDFQIYEYNLVKFQNLGSFFIEKIEDFNKNSSQKKGIIIFIDETQNIFEQGNKEELRDFQDFLKNFPDGKLKNKENEYVNISNNLKKIIIFLAIHPQTAALIFTKKQDIGDRCLTHSLELKQLNQYSAFKIIEKFVNLKKQKIEDWFDTQIIPLIFCLTPFITYQRYEKFQLNPRIFIELFFQICEYWRDSYAKGLKLTIGKFSDILRDEEISIGGVNVDQGRITLKFNDKDIFERVFNEIPDEEVKNFILSPKWKSLNDAFADKIEKYRQFFEIREGFILDESKFENSFIRSLTIDNQIKDQLNLLPKTCIYFENNPDNASYLVFDNDLKGSNYNILKNIFEANCLNQGSFFRLSSEYLKFFYNYEDELFREKGIYHYLNSDNKYEFFLDQLQKNLDSKQFEQLGIYQKIELLEMAYPNLVGGNNHKSYLTFESKIFDFIDKWEMYNVYFLTVDDINTVQQFFDTLIETQKNQVNVSDIIILEPYIKTYNLNQNISAGFLINKSEIFHPDIEEFKQLIGEELKDSKELIHLYLKNARKIIISNLIEKSLIIPLSNIKIGKDKDKHKEIFKDIINTALNNKIEQFSLVTSEEKAYSLNEFKNWLVFENDVDTGLDTISKFFQIDIKKEKKPNNDTQDQFFCFKCKISDYEIQFVKLLIHLSKNLHNENVRLDLLSATLDKVITVDTRINFTEFIEFILIEKQILTKKTEQINHNKNFEVYLLKHPKNNVLELINKLNIIIKYDLSQDEQKRYELIIKVLNGFLSDNDIEISYFDLNFDNPNEIDNIKSILSKFSIVNYYCKKIEDSLKQKYITIDSDLLCDLISNVKTIVDNLNITKTIKNENDEANNILLCFFNSILQEISLYNEEIFKLNEIFEKNKKNGPKNHNTVIEATDSEKNFDYYLFFKLLNFMFLVHFYENKIIFDKYYQEIKATDKKLDYILSKLKKINQLKELLDYINENPINEDNKIKFDKTFQELYKLEQLFERFIFNYQIVEEVEKAEDLIIDEEIEENESIEEEFDVLFSINLIENLLSFYKEIAKEVSNKKIIFNDLISNTTDSLRKIKIFIKEKQPLFTDLNFLIALKSNNLIEYDRLLENLFMNFNSNYYNFDYNEEFEIFKRLLKENLQLSQFYNDFINKSLRLISKENEFFSEFILICDNIKNNKIVSEIYDLFTNPDEKIIDQSIKSNQNNKKEEINKNLQLIEFNKLSIIEQFIWLYFFIHENEIARNFLYYLIFKEINVKIHNIDVIDNKKIHFKIAYEDFYKAGLLNKSVSIIYKYDSLKNEDIKDEPLTEYILANTNNIVSYYRNIIKEREMDISKIVEIKNKIVNIYPQYFLFKYYNKNEKSKLYYCPLESKMPDEFSINYYNFNKLNLILDEIINDFKIEHKIGIINYKDQSKFTITDNNGNNLSMNFIHPMMILKEIINKNIFRIDLSSKLKDIKDQIKITKINIFDFVNDILKDLIGCNFNLKECYSKTRNFFNKNISIQLEEIKNLCNFYENNFEDIKKFLISD